jgi:hypothetical protein
MASTRNKNMPSDYRLEKDSMIIQREYRTNPVFSVPTQSYHPGDGLLGAKTSRTVLSSNACDIESSLFGIGANNLENPQPANVPDLRTLHSLSVMNKVPLIQPTPIVVSSANRPMYLN